MILKIPWYGKKDQFTFIDNIEEVVGPRIVLWDRETRAFNDAETGEEATSELVGSVSIYADNLDKEPCSIVRYRRHGKDHHDAIVYSDKVYLMNDDGKTIETLR